LIAIAKATMEFTEDFIRKTGRDDCAKVEVYSPERLEVIELDDENYFANFQKSAGASYSVVNADSFEAAFGMEKSLVMNFANAHRPGGGFLNGARAQEESLCRCSTLYKSISSKEAREMYDYNNLIKEPCDSDYMLLSPNVYVYRTASGEVLDFPYWTSVVTVPAPDRCRAASRVPQDELDEIMTERLRKMLFLAARKGYRNLVLGAWGCGAFGNDTRRVAEYFHELFLGSDCFDQWFDNVKFAILGDEEKIDIFKSVFSDKLAMETAVNRGLNVQNGKTELFKFYQSDYDYPVCNHTEGVTEVNIGFARGVTASGVPFEAEVSQKDGIMTLAVVIPAIFNDAYEDVDENQELSDENINITAMHYDVESFDYSILDLGMIDDAMEENTDVVRDYVDFLIENGLVVYASNLLNGTVLYRVDALGNSLAKVLITMQDSEGIWAYTALLFEDFPTRKKRKERPELKIVKNGEQE
jgi:uncharacterized protein (TIGR02452 family)